jgi:outer membrane protein
MHRGWSALLVGVLVAGWGGVGSATAADRLSLANAMARARQQAREVKAAQARQQAAEERLTQAKGHRYPSLALSETWINTDSPADAFALQLNQERFSFNDFVLSDPNNPSRLDTDITRLEISLPLYTGGELSGRIAQADQAAGAAGDSAGWQGDNAALAAAEAYVTLEQAREYVALLGRARDTVKAHVDLARSYAEQGMIVDSEVMRAEVELSRVDDLLETARGNARMAASNLAFRLGEDLSTEWELAPLPAPQAPAGDVAEWLASAEKRKDLEAARKMLRAGELEEKVKRAAYLPKVGLVARGDLVDDTPFGGHGDSTTVIAVASLNLFAGGADRAAVAAARWEAKAGREDVERFAEGVKLQVRQAYEEARTAALRYATAAKALHAAAEAERITEERFKSGVVKMLDLIDATNARREAETRELVARADALSARLRLAVEAGRGPESALP